LKKKMPEMVEEEWFLHSDNALVHSVKGVQEFLGKTTSNCSSIPPIHLTWLLLTSCSPAEEGAGGLHHDPGGIQERVRRGPEGSRQEGVR
jgi:hypothetical protein